MKKIGMILQLLETCSGERERERERLINFFGFKNKYEMY